MSASRRGATPSSDLDQFLRARVSELRIAGLVVSVVGRDGVRFEGAYGRARRGGVAMTFDTPVVIGSAAKQFTGLAIHALVASGRLRLDDTVGTLLRDVGGAEGAFAEVTVEQLLCHRSGWSREDGLRIFRLGRTQPSIREETRRLLADERIGRPGERFEYSNANFIVLGAIIEAATGEPYETALQRLVAEPLGLSATTGDLERARRAGLADGEYTWFRVVNVPTPTVVTEATTPAGYIASTARDLGAVLRAHLGGPSGLASAVLADARAPIAEAEGGADYASGWYVRRFTEATGLIDGTPDREAPRLWEHDGDSLRTMSYVAFSPELDVGLVMLTNTALGTDGRRFAALSSELLRMVLGVPPPPQRADPFLTAVPSMFALPAAGLAATGWMVLTGRRSRPPGVARPAATAVAVGLATAALVTAFVVVPRRMRSRLTDSWWWVAVPDLAVSVGASLVVAAGTFVLGAGTALRRARQKTSGLGVDAWRIDTSAWRSKR